MYEILFQCNPCNRFLELYSHNIWINWKSLANYKDIKNLQCTMSNNQKIFHMKTSRTRASILIWILPALVHCSRAEQVQFQPVVHWHVVSLKFPAVLFWAREKEPKMLTSLFDFITYAWAQTPTLPLQNLPWLCRGHS